MTDQFEVIGVDLGGTNVRMAVVDKDAKMYNITKETSDIHKGKNHSIKKFESLLKKQTNDNKVKAHNFDYNKIKNDIANLCLKYDYFFNLVTSDHKISDIF